MTGWLKVRVNRGQFPGEFAVVTSTSDGQVISMFARDDVVDVNRNLVRVEVLDSTGDAPLVYLPAKPLEIASRAIRVARKELVG